MENSLLITLDTDWANDIALEYCMEILLKNNVKSTWFITNRSLIVEKLLEHPNLFEVGIHPNFFLGSDHGNSIDKVFQYFKDITPNARSMRSHGLYQHSNLLFKASHKYNIEIDSSIFLPYCSNIDVHLLNSLYRLPIFFMDSYYLRSEKNNSFKFGQINNINSAGLKTFDFHPIHIYMNSYSMKYYESLKSYISDSKKLEKNRNYTKRGIGDLFSSTINNIIENDIKTYTLYEYINKKVVKK